MKCQRVIIEVGAGTFTLELHPRLTVVAGLSATERESLSSELLAAFAGQRSGLHLTIRDATNRQLVVVRPRGGRHRVMDARDHSDVSHEFTVGGEIDLLARADLSLLEARDRLCVTPRDLSLRHSDDGRIAELARIDQKLLWATAENVHRTERVLGTEAEAVVLDRAEAEAVEAVEISHRRLELAQARVARTRTLGLRASAAAAVAAIPGAIVQPLVGAAPVAATAATMVTLVVARRSVVQATEAEASALAGAGAQSYLGFHLQRVNGMLSSVETRRRLTAAADLHRKALAAWRDLAGNHDVGWALDHRDEIMTAALLDSELSGVGGPAFASLRTVLGANLAHALAAKLASARRLGPARESYPMILDDPFAQVDAPVKPALLTLLGRWSGSPQVILLTEDPEVVSWARAEELTGDLALIEAAPVASAPEALVGA